jgi:DNA-binding NarL/FixJ family response regulator
MTDNAKPSVLIADDDPVVRAALSLQLKAGFTVVGSACDADEAIEYTEALRPDLAILDVQMPGGGGLRATREIRALAPEVAIVALSADESDASVRAMISAGAMAYVRKGVDRDELDRVLRSSIEALALAAIA